MTSPKWQNPLDVLGSRILAAHGESSEAKFLRLTQRAANENPVLACGILGALLQMGGSTLDCGDLTVDNGHFLTIDFGQRAVSRLTLLNCTFGSLTLPLEAPLQTLLKDYLAERVFGVASRNGLPPWITNLGSVIK